MWHLNIWSTPLTILREAIVSALVHSDYAQRGPSIRIAFFDECIDIESPGLLLPGMIIDDMKKRHLSHPQHRHRPRVPRVAPGRALGQRHQAHLCRGRRAMPNRHPFKTMRLMGCKSR